MATPLPTLPDLDSVFEGSISAGDLEDFYNVLGESSTPTRNSLKKMEEPTMNINQGGGLGLPLSALGSGSDYHVLHGGENYEDYVYSGSNPSSSSSMLIGQPNVSLPIHDSVFSGGVYNGSDYIYQPQSRSIEMQSAISGGQTRRGIKRPAADREDESLRWGAEEKDSVMKGQQIMSEAPQEVDMDADGKQISGASKQKKRFLWTDSLHQLFVAAIFDLGLQSATPKSLISLMNPRPDDITTDHIKSHLQKFRINLKISRDMFLRDYQAARAETDARFAEMVKRKENGMSSLSAQFGHYPLTFQSASRAADAVRISGQTSGCWTCRRYTDLFELGVGVPDEPDVKDETDERTRVTSTSESAPSSGSLSTAPVISHAIQPTLSSALPATHTTTQSFQTLQGPTLQATNLSSQLSSSQFAAPSFSAFPVEWGVPSQSSSISTQPIRIQQQAQLPAPHQPHPLFPYLSSLLPQGILDGLQKAHSMREQLEYQVNLFEYESSQILTQTMQPSVHDSSGRTSQPPAPYGDLISSIMKRTSRPHTAMVEQKQPSPPQEISVAEALERRMTDSLKVERTIRKRHDAQVTLYNGIVSTTLLREEDFKAKKTIEESILECKDRESLSILFKERFVIDDPKRALFEVQDNDPLAWLPKK